MLVEPTAGFEPATCCLRNSCSTTELCRPKASERIPCGGASCWGIVGVGSAFACAC